MSIFSSYFDLQKRGVGSLLGAIGGASQAWSGNVGQPGTAQTLRDIGGQLNPSRSYNLVPSAYAAEPQVYGMSTQPMQTKAPAPTPTTTTTGTTETTAPGGDGGATQDPLAALYAEIDNIYNTTMSYLGGQEAAVRANQPGVEADVMGQYAASQKGLETEKTAGERTLTTAETTAGQRKEDALAASRRLFNELQMGGQQRFGGASSAGQAYGELTGREFQRGQATTQQAYQNAMTKVMDLKANLQERFDASMFNLETQKNTALNQIRQAFQERLSQIDALKAEAGINKSAMRLDLLSQLRNQVYQLNLAAVQTQTQLNAQKQGAEQQLQAVVNAVNTAQTGSQQATTDLSGAASINPQTAYAITTGRQAPAQTYTGQITPTRREDLYPYA